MKAIVQFHKNLVDADPTPDHLRLYAEAPLKHGFSNDQKNASLFLGTFVLGLYQTIDRETNTFRTVPFAVSRSMDSWAIEIINKILGQIQKLRAKISKEERTRGNKMIVQAVTNLELGTRVFSVAEEPTRWVAFGFTRDSSAPEWLKRGLL